MLRHSVPPLPAYCDKLPSVKWSHSTSYSDLQGGINILVVISGLTVFWLWGPSLFALSWTTGGVFYWRLTVVLLCVGSRMAQSLLSKIKSEPIMRSFFWERYHFNSFPFPFFFSSIKKGYYSQDITQSWVYHFPWTVWGVLWKLSCFIVTFSFLVLKINVILESSLHIVKSYNQPFQAVTFIFLHRQYSPRGTAFEISHAMPF